MLAALAGCFGPYTGRTAPLQLITNPRNIGFMLGCVGAFQAARLRPFGRLFLLAGFAVLVPAWVIAAGIPVGWETPIVLPFALAYFFIVCGLASLDAVEGPLVTRLREPLLLLGNASYSIYLVHYPIVFLCGRIASDPWRPMLFVIAVCLSIFIGVCGYLVIERPLLATGRRQSQSRSYQ